MSKKNTRVKKELNDDIDWDYESYQGRSKRQVIYSENVSFYTIMGLCIVAIAVFVYKIFTWI